MIAALLSDLERAGVRLALKDGALKVRADKREAYSSELRERVNAHRDAIVAHLQAQDGRGVLLSADCAPSALQQAHGGNDLMTTPTAAPAVDPKTPTPPEFYTFARYQAAIARWGQAVADELVDLLPPWYAAHYRGDEAGKAAAAARFKARWQELQQEVTP